MTQTSDEVGFPVGERLKSARQALGYSQRELARRAHITNANLSMIEQDKVSPTLATLEKILQALSLNLADFFALRRAALPVYKDAEFVQIKRKGIEFRVLPATSENASLQSLARVTVSAGATMDGFWLKGSGIATGLVVTGSVDLVLSGEIYTLQEGDGFEFRLQCKHSVVNGGQDSATLVVCLDIKP